MSDAISADTACALTYLKPADTAPAVRRVLPRRLIYSDGFWYVLAFDLDREDSRFFRLDRILNATPIDDAQITDAARAAGHDAALPAPYVADKDHEVEVRYAPNIARWIAERTGEARDADGSIVLKHRVADSRWLVRHVLQNAGDAVVEAGEFRKAVLAAAERLAG
jgi:predicted DNA-binding transcriptional regulator YafY